MHTLAVLGAAACPAWAQSSLTVSGILDLGARSVTNDGVGSVKSLIGGSNSTSRIGLRGTEDLGDGLSAGFHLDGGLQADTGSNAVADQFWDRRATVSLASKTMGEVRLGRDYVPTYINWLRFDPFGYVGVANSGNLISSTSVGPIPSVFGTGKNTLLRSGNAARYLLPSNLADSEGGLMVAAGEGGTGHGGQRAKQGASRSIGLRSRSGVRFRRWGSERQRRDGGQQVRRLRGRRLLRRRLRQVVV